jgi:hypothetical protein
VVSRAPDETIPNPCQCVFFMSVCVSTGVRECVCVCARARVCVCVRMSVSVSIGEGESARARARHLIEKEPQRVVRLLRLELEREPVHCYFRCSPHALFLGVERRTRLEPDVKCKRSGGWGMYVVDTIIGATFSFFIGIHTPFDSVGPYIYCCWNSWGQLRLQKVY